jgi:hypothetical protein
MPTVGTSKIHKPRRMESRKVSFYQGALKGPENKGRREVYRKTYTKSLTKSRKGKH